MRFFSSSEIRGKIPDALVDAFDRSEFKYLVTKKELDKVKDNQETIVDDFLVLAQCANDAYLEWKGANMAIARFLNQRPALEKELRYGY